MEGKIVLYKVFVLRFKNDFRAAFGAVRENIVGLDGITELHAVRDELRSDIVELALLRKRHKLAKVMPGRAAAHLPRQVL